MEQSPSSVILEYHKSQGPTVPGYWTSMDGGGKETKWVRIVAGVATPQLERQGAALIVLGELFRSSQPADFHGIFAAVGNWVEIRTALLQVCRDQKPDTIVVQDEPTRKLVYPITDAMVGAPVVPACYAAPPPALDEPGRQMIDMLIGQDQLHIEPLLPILDSDREQADKALRCAIGYMLEYGAIYPTKKRGPLELKRVFGSDGL